MRDIGILALMLLTLIAVALSQAPYASQTPLSAPIVFAPDQICTENFESHPEFTQDGKTLYFVKANDEFTYWTVMVSLWQKGKWTAPEVAHFSGKHRDADPFIAADGKRFLFISDRPCTPGEDKKDMDIWMMERKADGWGEPIALGPEVNTKGDEWYPTVARDGTLYFCSPRKGGSGGLDIWYSTLVDGKYTEAKNVGSPINTAGSEVEAYISPDGKLLIWDADGPGSLGGLDFYYSRRGASGWSKPKHMRAPISSIGTELSPKLTPDGKYFIFTSDRKGGQGLGDIWIVDAAAALAK